MIKPTRTLHFPNPRNANPALNAEHTIYLAGTGGGKTSAVFHMPTIPRGAQVVIFDPYGGYEGRTLKGQRVLGTPVRGDFLAMLVRARKAGKPFKLAYRPMNGACEQELEFFAACCWAVGNGRAARLHCVMEELASCVSSAGKLMGKAGELYRGGRQFGLVCHALFQKAQEVPKTVTDQSDLWWVGKLQSGRDVDWVARQRNIPPGVLEKLVSAKQNRARLNKPIAEYLMITDFGQYQKGAFNCATGYAVSLNYR